MVDPRLLQSAEVQEIVKRHSAEFVELDPLHVHEYQGSGDHGELPHMPVPQHGRDATTEDGGGSQVTSQPGWLWGTMAWLLGVSDSSGSHQPVPSSPSEEALPFPPQRLFKNPVQSGARSETRLEDSHVISQSFRGAPAPRDVQRNFERPDYGGPTASVRNSLEESPILASTPMQNSETQDTIHALPREFKKQNSAYPEQRSPHSDSSNASVSSRSWIEYDSQASSQGDDEERDHPFSDVSYSYMRQDQQLAPMPYGERHVVYVEMGDGRLVHRLSTIGERTTIGDRNTSQESFSTVRTANLSDLGAPLPGALPR